MKVQKGLSLISIFFLVNLLLKIFDKNLLSNSIVVSIPFFIIITIILIKILTYIISSQLKNKNDIHIKIEHINQKIHFKSSNEELVKLIEDYLRNNKSEKNNDNL